VTQNEFESIARRYPNLRVAIVGDYCLDRYLEIDPRKSETSIETGRPVYNVTDVRFQPGGAGTILNNLAALGIGEIIPIGFCGRDAEGHELHEALNLLPGINLNHFLCTPERRTFTYCKPLLCRPGEPPEELNRIDFKNWSKTPSPVTDIIADSLQTIASEVDAIIVLDQVDEPDTGVITERVLQELGRISRQHPGIFIIGDSRRGFTDWPEVCFKMNSREFARHTNSPVASPEDVVKLLEESAIDRAQPIFVTLAEHGIAVASPGAQVLHEPGLPARSEIDIVGAGDAVTANLAAAIATGCPSLDAASIANHAASIVIQKLGTTGTASVPEISGLLSSHSDASPEH